MNNEGYIFIVQRLEKQSKLIFSRLDSISNLKLNLRIHGQCGPDAHSGADLQAFLIFRFKPILISAHKLTLLIYGDNSGGEGPLRPIGSPDFLLEKEGACSQERHRRVRGRDRRDAVGELLVDAVFH